MEERSIYISSVDREKVGTSKTHDFKIKLQTIINNLNLYSADLYVDIFSCASQYN